MPAGLWELQSLYDFVAIRKNVVWEMDMDIYLINDDKDAVFDDDDDDGIDHYID